MKTVRVEASDGRLVREYVRVKTGRMVPCPGDAHKNAHIDHCGVCEPRWGEIEEMAPIDLDAARRAGLAVPLYMLSEIDFARVTEMERQGLCKTENVERKRNGRLVSSYCVVMWTEIDSQDTDW